MRQRYIAKVIDNVDTETAGRVQIFIESLMWGFLPADYPWALQDRSWTSDIPEIDDLVWVYFEDEVNYKIPFYMNKISLKGNHDHNETIGSMTSAYPDVKYQRLSNGVAIGISSSDSTPEISIVHPTGTEIYIDPVGFIFINTGDAGAWAPNTLQVCPLTGLPHGGITAGILKLSGL